MTVDEFHECDAALRRDPRVIEALAQRGITDLDRVLIDTWAYGAHLVPEAAPRRPDRLGRRLVPQPAGLEPVRATRSPGCTSSSTSTAWSCSRSRTTHRVDEPRHDGRVRPAPRARPAAARRTSSRCDIIQPEGVVLHARRQRAELAEVVAARRLQPPRGPGPAHGRLRRRAPVAHRLSFAEMVVPYRDPTTDHYRRTAFDIGEWGLGFMTTSLELGLRLPRARSPTSTRCMHDTARRALHDPQRDLHPRGGRRGPLEARRRADAARRCAASRRLVRLLPRHRRQLRVPRLLALLPGRQHRVRGAGDRDHGHDALRRGRSSRRTARSSTSAPTRRSTSTSSSRAWTSTSTARPTRSTRPSPRRCRSARTTRTGSRSSSATRRCAPSRRASRTTTGARQRAWKVVNDNVTNGLGTPVGYKLVPGGALPADDATRTRRCSSARRRSATRCG